MSISLKKVLTIRAASLGDALLGKYFLENIHAIYPDAKCYLLVPMREEMIRELLSQYLWITVIEVNRKKPLSILKALIILWRTDITLTQAVSEGKFPTASKIFARIITKKGGLIGYFDIWRHTEKIYDILLTTSVTKSILCNEKDALQALDIPISLDKPTLLSNNDEVILKKFNLHKNRYVVLHLFSGSDYRGLSRENMERIAGVVSVYVKEESMKLILTGGYSEKDVIAEIAQLYDAIPVAGETSVEDLINLINFSAKIVSVDTGAAHIASGLKKRLIVLRCYQTKHWWMPEHYSERVTVLTGEKGKNETMQRNKKYPTSLNSIKSEDILLELKRPY